MNTPQRTPGTPDNPRTTVIKPACPPWYPRVRIEIDAVAVECASTPSELKNHATAWAMLAGPDLLAALQALVHPDGLSSAVIRQNLDAARAAIARATGQEGER